MKPNILQISRLLGNNPWALCIFWKQSPSPSPSQKQVSKSVSLSLNPPKGELAGEEFGVEGNGSLLSHCDSEKEIGSHQINYVGKERNYFFTNFL